MAHVVTERRVVFGVVSEEGKMEWYGLGYFSISIILWPLWGHRDVRQRQAGSKGSLNLDQHPYGVTKETWLAQEHSFYSMDNRLNEE